MNRLKLLFPAIAAVVISSMAMLTGCDKNEDVGEIWDYPWYLNPDTGRGTDGKLYFSPNDLLKPTKGGFLTKVTGIDVKKKQTGYGECHAITSLGGSWIVDFSFTGDMVNAYTDFNAFKDLCRQTGFRPGVKTPYDPDLLKLQPIYDWDDDANLCCNPIKSIQIISQKEYKTLYETVKAGDDLSRHVFMRTVYYDDSFAWHSQHKDRYPVVHNYIPDANFNITGAFPVLMYNARPQKYIANGFELDFKSIMPMKETGDYPIKLIIKLDNGEEFSADLMLKIY